MVYRLVATCKYDPKTGETTLKIYGQYFGEQTSANYLAKEYVAERIFT